MRVTIQRDQAVWERETFEVEIADALLDHTVTTLGLAEQEISEQEEALLAALQDAIDGFQGYTDDDYSKEILDSLPSIDMQIIARLPCGVEIDL